MNNQIRSFLSLHEEPLKSLPASLGDEWILWEKTAKSIPSLLSAGTLRQIIDNELPQLKFSTISGEPSTIIERVYTMLCFLSHAYIRGSPGDALIKVFVFTGTKVSLIFRNYHVNWPRSGLMPPRRSIYLQSQPTLQQ